jgi:hypothetical protein
MGALEPSRIMAVHVANKFITRLFGRAGVSKPFCAADNLSRSQHKKIRLMHSHDGKPPKFPCSLRLIFRNSPKESFQHSFQVKRSESGGLG